MEVRYNNRTGCIVICNKPKKTEGGNLGDSLGDSNCQDKGYSCGRGSGVCCKGLYCSFDWGPDTVGVCKVGDPPRSECVKSFDSCRNKGIQIGSCCSKGFVCSNSPNGTGECVFCAQKDNKCVTENGSSRACCDGLVCYSDYNTDGTKASTSTCKLPCVGTNFVCRKGGVQHSSCCTKDNICSILTDPPNSGKCVSCTKEGDRCIFENGDQVACCNGYVCDKSNEDGVFRCLIPDVKINGIANLSIISDFKGGYVYGQQYFTKIFNLNRLQYKLRIGLYGGFIDKHNILNNIKSNPSQIDKENFVKSHMKCIYRDQENNTTLFPPTDIDINQWQNNFCLYKGVIGSPCRCYDFFPDECYNKYPPDQNYNTLDNALDTIIDGKTAKIAQTIEGGVLISPADTPSITNLPNYIYEATNNYYYNYINNNYWSFNGQQLESNNNSFGLCLLSNKILTLPCGLVFDDSNKGDNYFGLVNYSIDLINNIKGTTKALTHTYYINSQNYKGYTNCILPSFFTLDDKYGFDNNDTMQYKPIKGNRVYNMEINSIRGIEYKGVLKIPKLFMPKGNDIELLRDVYTMNNNLYNKNNIDTYYTNLDSSIYYSPFNYNGIPFDGMYSISNNGNSSVLKWENSKQEISEYWKLNDAGDKYIAVDSTEVDPNLVNSDLPRYISQFNYTKSPDYIEYTKSISVNSNDIFGRKIKISYQWVRFIDQITIRKYKEKLLKDNTKADVDTYLNNLQTKIENFHKGNTLESSFYPQTDLKSDQLVKLLDVQLVSPPSEFSYGYVAEVYEMIYSE